jgi:proteasome lid subunit RPN8/RPN11
MSKRQAGAHRSTAYTIFSLDFAKLRRTALRAQKSGQQEVCGVLAGSDRTRIELWFLANRSPHPGRFQIARADYLQARRAIRQLGKKTFGTFHSHPISEAIPARADIAGAALNSLCLIYDVCARQARLWRILKRGNRKVAREVLLQKKATSEAPVTHPRHKTSTTPD